MHAYVSIFLTTRKENINLARKKKRPTEGVGEEEDTKGEEERLLHYVMLETVKNSKSA